MGKALCKSLWSTRPQCPDISDRELAYFLMYKTDAFLEDGKPISPAESPYIWLGDVCSGRPDILQPETATGHHMIADPAKKSTARLPLDVSSLKTLILTLESYNAHKFAAAQFVLGGYILSVHYGALMSEYETVPATIAYGQVQCGKSKVTKAALATVGLITSNFISTISDSSAFHLPPRPL